MKILILLLLVTTQLLLRAELSKPGEITFSANRYERDLKNQTSRGIGKAWVKKGDFLLEADELEIDYKSNEVLALGNVHYHQGKMDVYADKGTYSLSGEKATMHNATVINEKMVFTGKLIRRLSKDSFEMEEGLYTNCNTTPVLDRSVKQCYFDWKLYARRFDIIIEGYMNAYDAILYAKDLPVTYLPYYRAPAKAKRQSGFLYPQFIAFESYKGSGFSMPYYLVLGDWHDFTLSPDYFGKSGYHIGTNYRYAYSSSKSGEVNFYFTQSRFPEVTGNPKDRDLPNEVTFDRKRTLGVIGEWALNMGNTFNLGGEAHTNQNIALVSDPYYPVMYESDLGPQGQMGYLKSQVSATFPQDNWLYTGLVRYDQSLIMTKETGTDNGPVGQLPSLGVFKKSTGLLNYFSYDFDARLNNYYRLRRAIDKVPDPTIGRDVVQDLDGNDYIREGRRLQLEPRLVMNLPLPRGFEMLPELKAGTLLYNFDYGESNFVDREYVDFQIPFSLYLSKRFSTDIAGLEEVRHVFIPKVTYANAIYRSEEPTHQFFYNGKKTKSTDPDLTPLQKSRIGLSSPRFDILDQVQKYQFGRIDFEHSLYRRVATGYEQFLVFTLGQQYNLTQIQSNEFADVNYLDTYGPIESRLTVTLGKFLLQSEASYRLVSEQVVNEKNEKESDFKHNYTLATTLAYTGESGSVNLNFLHRHNNFTAQENSTFNFSVVKTLPTFFDISTGVNYDARIGLFKNYFVTFNFAAKPYSCWKLDLTYAIDKQSFDLPTRTIVTLKFGLSFGGNVVFGL